MYSTCRLVDLWSDWRLTIYNLLDLAWFLTCDTTNLARIITTQLLMHWANLSYWLVFSLRHYNSFIILWFQLCCPVLSVHCPPPLATTTRCFRRNLILKRNSVPDVKFTLGIDFLTELSYQGSFPYPLAYTDGFNKLYDITLILVNFAWFRCFF